jgi:hypothetical protein
VLPPAAKANEVNSCAPEASSSEVSLSIPHPDEVETVTPLAVVVDSEKVTLPP